MARICFVFALVGTFACNSEDPPTRYPGLPIGDSSSSGDATGGDPVAGDAQPGDAQPGDGACASCLVPWDCSTGETCDVFTGCCIAAPVCLPETCIEPQFCHDTDCLTATSVCLLHGCECHVVGDGGVDPTGTPVITMATGAQRAIEVVLAVIGGDVLPAQAFDLSVMSGSPAPFTVNGTSVVATATAGGATLTASVGTLATCEATLVNIGSQPAAGTARFLVQDAASGVPVGGAQVIVDSNADGVDDGGAAVTDSGGQTSATVPGSGTYTVTVTHTGYHPLSVVGLSATASRDILLPLRLGPAQPVTGGFDGKIDFEPYERQILGGAVKTIKLAFVAPATGLTRYVHFDDALLWGSTTNADCEPAPHPPGCYEIGIPGLVDPPIWTAMPGGWIMSLPSNPLKSHFELAADPGLRHASALAVELEVSDLSGVINRMLDAMGDCECDDGIPDSCPSDCSCDADCAGFPVLRMVLDYVPLFGWFASDVRGNLELGEAPVSDWEDHLSVPYEDRIPEPFARLDGYLNDRLAPAVRLSQFSDLAVPGLPPDPVSIDGRGLDGLVVVTGVVVPGGDFVPLGWSAAADCTTANCADRDGAGAGDFDGVVNGALACLYDPDPELNGCPPGVPINALADGHVALFHAPAHSGLEGLPWVTLVVALPEFGLDFRSAGFVVRAEPTVGASSQLAGGTFPAHAALPAQVTSRTYVAPAAANVNGHRVTFTDGSVRWQVFFVGASGTFVAPAVSGDPFAGGSVDVEHVALRMATAASLETLTRNDGTSLQQVGDLMEGFAAQHATLPVP